MAVYLYDRYGLGGTQAVDGESIHIDDGTGLVVISDEYGDVVAVASLSEGQLVLREPDYEDEEGEEADDSDLENSD